MFGYFLQRFKLNKTSILQKVIYIMVSGFITFTFFRDGFVTSLIKNIFQFSILTPVIFVVIASILTDFFRRFGLNSVE